MPPLFYITAGYTCHPTLFLLSSKGAGKIERRRQNVDKKLKNAGKIKFKNSLTIAGCLSIQGTKLPNVATIVATNCHYCHYFWA